MSRKIFKINGIPYKAKNGALVKASGEQKSIFDEDVKTQPTSKKQVPNNEDLIGSGIAPYTKDIPNPSDIDVDNFYSDINHSEHGIHPAFKTESLDKALKAKDHAKQQKHYGDYLSFLDQSTNEVNAQQADVGDKLDAWDDMKNAHDRLGMEMPKEYEYEAQVGKLQDKNKRLSQLQEHLENIHPEHGSNKRTPKALKQLHKKHGDDVERWEGV